MANVVTLPPDIDFVANPAASPARMNMAMTYLYLALQGSVLNQSAFDQLLAQLQQTGLERINDALQPFYQELTAQVAQYIALTTANAIDGGSAATPGTRIELRRSSTAGELPASLNDGELFINEADNVLAWRDATGAMQTCHLLDVALIGSKANAASPAFTGTPTTPAPVAGDRSTKIPNTAWVGSEITMAVDDLVNSAPGTLDTLKELADALGDDANYAATTAVALGNRLRVDAAQGLTAPQQAQAQANLGVGSGSLANPFHNASCNVAQRGTGSLTITTSGGYSLDGWYVLPIGSSVAAAHASGIGFALSSLKLTGATGNTDVKIMRRVESYIAAPFAGQMAMLQFKLKNNSGAPITPSVVFKHPTAQDNFSSLSSADATVSAQMCPNGQTTQCAIAVMLASAITAGLQIGIDIGALASSADTVQISEIDMVVSPSATAGLIATPSLPRLRDIREDLHFCQRYFYEPPGGSFTLTTGVTYADGPGYEVIVPYALPNQMRAAPSVQGAWSNLTNQDTYGTNTGADNHTIVIYLSSGAVGYFGGTYTFNYASAEL